jgi:hypothetical protein
MLDPKRFAGPVLLTRPAVRTDTVSVPRLADLHLGLTAKDGGNAGFAGAKTCLSDALSPLRPRLKRLLLVPSASTF